jgi:hypothetical protein
MLVDVTGRPIAVPPPRVGPIPLQSLVPKEIGIGAATNLHLLVGRRYDEWNRYLHEMGGENVFRGPNYRLVWGWERPHAYGLPDPSQLEFFHIERWVPIGLFCDEDEWYGGEMALAKHIPNYRIQRYPKQGEYVLIRTCRWGLCDKCNEAKCGCPNRHRTARFRWPDKHFLGGALVEDFYRRSRSGDDIKAEVQETEAFKKKLETEALNKIQDEYGIRDLVETETDLLIRNPSLRKDPGLLVSPAVAHKPTRRRIANTL